MSVAAFLSCRNKPVHLFTCNLLSFVLFKYIHETKNWSKKYTKLRLILKVDKYVIN